MPLSNVRITKSKKILKNLVYSADRLKDIKKIQKVMEKDGNFMSFVNGTSAGMKIFEEIDELISLVINDIYYDLDNLNDRTYKFLNKQEELNRKIQEKRELVNQNNRISFLK